MEQKKVQRIIGILVVIALVIIVMPLLISKNDFVTQEAENTTKSAPIPDQSLTTTVAQTTTTEASAPLAPVLTSSAEVNKDSVAGQQDGVTNTTTAATAAPVAATSNLPAPPVLSGQATSPADTTVANNSSADNQTVEITPEIAKKLNEASNTSAVGDRKPGSVVYEPAPTAQSMNKPVEQATAQNPIVINTVAAALVKEEPSVSPSVMQNKQSVKKPPTKSAPAKVHQAKATAKKTLLTQKKTAAWAVQMGNFSVKSNATRMVSMLRTQGYKAFTREIKSANGKVNTRVYIGPEIKQASAAKISRDIHNNLSLQGVVVSYKPIA